MSYKDAKGWLTAAEREFLYYSAGRSPATLLNVGIEYGASLVCLQEGTSHLSIVAIDVDLSKVAVPFSHLTIPIERDSGEIAADWPTWAATLVLPSPNLGFVFIDGDHGEIAVTRDIAFSEYIVVGGVIAFHDCYSWDAPLSVHHHSPGVNIAVQNWIDNQPPGKWQELPVVDSIRAFARLS